MIRVTAKQLESMQAAQTAALADDVLRVLEHAAPQHFAGLSEHDRLASVRRGVANALAAGMPSRTLVVEYVHIELTHGEDVFKRADVAAVMRMEWMPAWARIQRVGSMIAEAL
ncbi:MAG: hypothetical protein HQL40_00520 [Alphaproteobacteria bacterium]|nr:hypothetical protein [Alphaproteobacteria bacterium]